MIESVGSIITWKNKILLGHPVGAPVFSSWSIPKGKIEPGETKIETCIRETQEEFGIDLSDLSPNRHMHLVTYYNKQNRLFKKVWCYHYPIKSLSELDLQSIIIPTSQLQKTEIDMALFFDLEDAIPYIFWRMKFLLNELNL